MSASITADPNPVTMAREGRGCTSLRWAARGAHRLEVRLHTPDGPLFSASGASGYADTGVWVRDGTVFCLQNVSNGQPLTEAHTLATVKVRVVDEQPTLRAVLFRGRSTLSVRQRLVQYLRTKYEISLDEDPVRSLADLFLRHMYARRYQRGLRSIPRRVAAQYRQVSLIFYVRRMVRKLRLGPIPIRIVFIAQDPLDWLSLDSVYRACAADPRFSVRVINAGFAFRGFVSDCAALFEERGIACLDGVRDRVRLDRLHADLFALASPYDDFRPHQFSVEQLLRYGKILYVSYGVDFAARKGPMARNVFGADAVRHAWRIVSRSSRTLPQYRAQGGIPARRVLCVGHPRLDRFHEATEASLPADLRAAGEGKLRIIYAPHHSLDSWSTFANYAAEVRRFVDVNEDCHLVFRPHPLLSGAIARWAPELEPVFQSLCRGERCQLYDGDDYYALFRWSDLLISDASSFLVEYAPTRKPIIYLHREDGDGLDETIEEEVFRSCHVARSAADIDSRLQSIKRGDAPPISDRDRYLERMSVGLFTGGAGKRVADTIGDLLAPRP